MSGFFLLYRAVIFRCLLLTLVAAAPCTGRAFAQSQCSVKPTVYIHSAAQTSASAATKTNDETIYITLTGDHASFTSWSMQDASESTHTFSAADGERFDLATKDGDYKELTFTLQDGTRSSCTLQRHLVVFNAGKATVALVEDSGAWPAVDIGNVAVSPALTVSEARAWQDGDHLHLNGRISYNGLQSALIDITLRGTTLAIPQATFFVAPVGAALGDTPYRISVKQDSCQLNRPETCFTDAKADLDVGGAHYTLTATAFGFESSNSAHTPCADTGILKHLCITSAIIDAKSRTLRLSGNACFIGTGSDCANVAVTDFGVACNHGANICKPTGNFTFNGLPAWGKGLVQITKLQGSFDEASDTLTFTIDGTTDVHWQDNDIGFSVSGLQATLTPSDGKWENAIRDGKWSFQYQTAKIVPAADAMLFGRGIKPCNDAALKAVNAMATPDPNAVNVCLGVHLNRGSMEDGDIAYGDLALTENAASPSDPPLQFKSLHIVLPQSNQSNKTWLRFGAGRMEISQVDVDATQSADPASFDSGIAADFTSTTNGPPPRSGFTCTPYLKGAFAIDAVQLATNTQSVDAEPTLWFGRGCTVFNLNGTLPLQLGTQSSLILTGLAFGECSSYAAESTPTSSTCVAASDPGAEKAAEPLLYVRASGVYTSGNVTVIFNDLGLRLTHLPDPKANPQPPVCTKEYDEFQFGKSGACVIFGVNWKESIGITAAQNAPSILKWIGDHLGSFAAGFLGGRIK